MSEQEKYWYQDGWNLLTIVAVLIPIGVWANQYWQQQKELQKPVAMALSTGYLGQPFNGDPVLHLKFWHVHRGNLKQGRLTVLAGSSESPKD